MSRSKINIPETCLNLIFIFISLYHYSPNIWKWRVSFFSFIVQYSMEYGFRAGINPFKILHGKTYEKQMKKSNLSIHSILFLFLSFSSIRLVGGIGYKWHFLHFRIVLCQFTIVNNVDTAPVMLLQKENHYTPGFYVPVPR